MPEFFTTTEGKIIMDSIFQFLMNIGGAFIYSYFYFIVGGLLWIFIWGIIIFCFLISIFLIVWIFKGLDKAHEIIKAMDFSTEWPILSQTVFERLAGSLLLFCAVYTFFSFLGKFR
jgi:amino acid transporter